MTSTSPGPRWSYEPFAPANSARLAGLRELFARHRFTEPEICATAKIGSMYELSLLKTRTDVLLDTADPQSMLVQLFVDGEPLSWNTVRSTLGDSDVQELIELGLLQTSILDPDKCTASVALYPNQGLYFISDKHSWLESVAEGVPSDIVYSAMTPETHRFIELMPRIRCGDYLELCSGTGIAALIAARTFAERAWAIDIADRSTRFAEFNAALNGLANVTALTGDLYAPVAGQTFDLIVAHPPYVPSFETEMIFRDGGEDGEQITRRIIAGLSEHLRPGGQFYCDCMMTDRADAPLEERIRSMLGPGAPEFDIILGEVELLDPDEFFARLAKTFPPESLVQRREALDALQVERFIAAAFLIQRRAEVRDVFTRRRRVSSATTAEHFQWYLRWSTATAQWHGDATTLLDSRPKRVPGVEFHSRSLLGDDGWKIASASLVTRVPFALEANCPAWFATLLARCDGSTTARAHLRHLRDMGVVPDSAPDAEFARLIGRLADGGFVELSEFPFHSLDDDGQS